MQRCLLLLLMFFLLHTPARAQQFTSEGTEFYITFIIPFDRSPGSDVIFSSAVNTTVTVENNDASYRVSYPIAAGIPLTISLPNDRCIGAHYGMPAYDALHITSVDPITVHCMNYEHAVADGSLLYPVSACGNEYYVASYETVLWPSKFMIVATEDNTVVKITPSVKTHLGHDAGVPYTVKLSKGQTYVEAAASIADLSNTHIIEENGKKLVVFSGSVCSYVPANVLYCDALMEQLPPVSIMGQNYLIVPLATETVSPAYIYRIFATDNNTELYVDGGKYKKPLQKGEMLTVNNQANPLNIRADKPIMVTQYIQSENQVHVGDPAMVIPPPTEQFIEKGMYGTPIFNEFTSHYLAIIIKTSALGTLKIDNQPIAPVKFTQFFRTPQYSYANIKVSPGGHKIECDSGFSAIAYGYGAYISYAFVVGTKTKNIEHSTTISPILCDSLHFEFSNQGDASTLVSSFWDFGDGTTAMGGKISKTYAKHGTYTVTNIVTTSNRIGADTNIRTIITRPSPKINLIINDTAQCQTDNVFIFNDNTTFIAGSIKTLSTWEFSNTAKKKYDSLELIRHLPDAGTYTVKLTVEADNGCVSTTKQTVHVYPAPELDIAINDTALCYKNHLFSITNNSTVNPGSIAKTQWLYSDGDTSTQFVPPPKKFDSAGVYTLKFVITTDIGCSDSVEKKLIVYPSPTPDFLPSTVCLGDTSLFINTTVDTKNLVNRWVWTLNDTFITSTFNAGYRYTDTGHYTIALAAYTKDGCADTTVKTNGAVVLPEPKAGFVIDNIDSSGFNYIVNFSNQSVGADTIVWDFGDKTKSNEENPAHRYTSTGLYKILLTVTSAGGCSNIYDTSLYVFIPFDIYVPNAFTPGGNNGLNPVFKVTGYADISSFEMMIFDRWGELLFKTNNIDEGWDGTFKNTDVPAGAYLYIVNILADEGLLNYRGTLTLLR